MSKTQTSPAAPVAPKGHPDQQPHNGHAGGSPVPSGAQSESRDDALEAMRAELAANKAETARLQQRLADTERETKRKAPPDRRDESFYRDQFSFTDDMLEQGTAIWDGAYHMTQRQIQQATDELMSQQVAMMFDAVVNSHIPNYKAILRSNSFDDFCERYPSQKTALDSAWAMADTGTTIQVLRAWESWMDQQRQQRAAPQPEPVYEQDYGYDYVPAAEMSPDPYANRYPHPEGNPRPLPRPRPEPHWNIPPFEAVDRSEQSALDRQPRPANPPDMSHTMMPRAAASPPPSNGRGPQYDINQVFAEKQQLATIPVTRRSAEQNARSRYLDSCIADYDRRAASGR